MNSSGGSNAPGPNPGGGSTNSGGVTTNPGPGGNHPNVPVGNPRERLKSKLRRGINLIMRDRNGDAYILEEGSHIGTQTYSTVIAR